VLLGKLPMDDPRVRRARARLFGSWDARYDGRLLSASPIVTLTRQLTTRTVLLTDVCERQHHR